MLTFTLNEVRGPWILCSAQKDREGHEMIHVAGQITKLLRMLRTVITARGLEVLLLGKEVRMPDGARLGAVTAIKKELSQDKIWMVIDNLGQKTIVPIEQIANVADKMVLLGDLPLPGLAADGDRSGS
jgi:hypothetical protein